MSKLPFVEIVKRITGISTPVFGVSWEPPQLERDTAQRLLTFLEDQRLLLGDYKFLLEHPNYVEESLYRLRNRLTEDLETLDRSSSLAMSISAMRAACRKCLNTIQRYPLPDRYSRDYEWLIHEPRYGSGWSWSAIGELRAVFGLHVAQLCAKYGFDIEEDLKSILPEPDVESVEDKNNGA